MVLPCCVSLAGLTPSLGSSLHFCENAQLDSTSSGSLALDFYQGLGFLHPAIALRDKVSSSSHSPRALADLVLTLAGPHSRPLPRPQQHAAAQFREQAPGTLWKSSSLTPTHPTVDVTLSPAFLS